MATKKRKTLPQNFDEILQQGSLDEQKEVFKLCALDAYERGYAKNTALHNYYLNKDLLKYLIAQGADIECPNAYGKRPLHVQSSYGTNLVSVLLELGADIECVDSMGNTPLIAAVAAHKVEATKILLEHGANINAKNQLNFNALEYGLSLCSNIDIVAIAKISQMMLDKGMVISPNMSQSVRNIGEQFERYRADFNPDFLEDTDHALSKLYELFMVEPIAKRIKPSIGTRITLPKGTLNEQYDYLWELLVPNNGPASTVQGEVIRIAGRVRHEFFQNGGANWDRAYRSMLNALLKHLKSHNSLDESQLLSAKTISHSIKASGDFDFDLLDSLCHLAVLWVAKNLEPLALSNPSYQR